MAHSWSFTSNVFRLLAERSLQRFFKFCFILLERMKSNTTDPFFNDKLMQLLPLFTSFNDVYDQKIVNKSFRIGDTKLLKQLLKQMSSINAHTWDVAIQNVFLKTTPEYSTIFPKGLTPLSTLPIEQRIKYLGSAVVVMQNYSALAQVMNEMILFHDSLLKARGNQAQKDGNVNDSKEEVMLKAYELADEIYGVLGEFIQKYKKNPLQIEAYFPVFLLRYKKKGNDINPDVYEIKIAKAGKAEGGFSFSINEKINLYVTGNTELEVYFVPDKNAAKPSNTIKLLPQDIKTILIKDYANQDDRFLMIENLSATEDGEIEISQV